MDSALKTLTYGGLSIGLEAPLDNDWSPREEAARQSAGRMQGEPNLQHHAELAQLADQLGFRALWIRDVPVYDPGFGDAAQVFETFSYLGYLAGITRRILLGTAAVVLPLREMLLTFKSASTIQYLSSNRLLLGVASGDRPVEYPLFSRDFNNRGESFRQQVIGLRNGVPLNAGMAVLPRLAEPLPLLAAGLAQQNPAWIAENMDGCLAYPGTPEEHLHRVSAWRAVAGEKPYVSFIHLDLLEDPFAPLQRFRFGAQVGRHGLITELEAMRDAGVQHIGLHLRRNQRPLKETLYELAEFVLPHFHIGSV